MGNKFKKIINRLLGYFVRGLLFVAPVGFTFLILYSGFDFVDSLVRIKFPSAETKQEYFIPGLGFSIVVGLTMFIGFVFTTLLPQTIQNWIENGIKNLPFVRIFYSAFKDLISAFVGDKKKFKQAVLVTINKESNIKKLGFMTQDQLSEINMENMVAVYMPHSYAFSGELYIVPKENVELVDIPAAVAMKIIVSGGVSFNE
jgi:uncharacterized membrane protein